MEGNPRLHTFKTGIDPDKMTDERKEKGLSIRKEKRETKLAKKRGKIVNSHDGVESLKSMSLMDALQLAISNIFINEPEKLLFGLGHLDYIISNDAYNIADIHGIISTKAPKLIARLSHLLANITHAKCTRFTISILYNLINSSQGDFMKKISDEHIYDNLMMILEKKHTQNNNSVRDHSQSGHSHVNDQSSVRDLVVATFICAMETSRTTCEHILLKFWMSLETYFTSFSNVETQDLLCWYVYTILQYKTPALPWKYVSTLMKGVNMVILSKTPQNGLLHALEATYALQGRGGKESPVFLQFCEPLYKRICFLCGPGGDIEKNNIGYKALQILRLIFSLKQGEEEVYRQCVLAFVKLADGLIFIQNWLKLDQTAFLLVRILCARILEYIVFAQQFEIVSKMIEMDLIENICSGKVVSDKENNNRLLLFSNVIRFLLPHECMRFYIFDKLFESGKLIQYFCSRLTFPDPEIAIDVLQNLHMCISYDSFLAKERNQSIGMVMEQLELYGGVSIINQIAFDHANEEVANVANSLVELIDGKTAMDTEN